MDKLFLTTILTLAFLTVGALAQGKTFFQTVAGNWEGELEYSDYGNGKRVKLRTYLTIKPSADGNSAEVTTVYDDFGTIMKGTETERIDPNTKIFTAGKYSYKIDSVEDGKIILLGSGQDGEKIEPIRRTITFSENTLTYLKETRDPWQFRNSLTLKRVSENVLERKTFAPARLREDFEVFKKALTTLHPGLYRYNTPAGLEKDFAAFEAELDKDLSEGEFFLRISQFLYKLKCGHTYTNFYNQNGLVRERLFNGKNYLPFYFRLVGDKMIVTENASPNALAKGSEITKLNGVKVKDIVAKLLTVTKADGNSTLEHRLSSIELVRAEAERYALFDWYFPLFFPFEGDKFTVEAIDFGTKKKTTFQVSAMTKDERKKEMTKRYGPLPTYDDGWKFEIQDGATGFLKIDNSLAWRLKKIDFKKFLAEAFAELRAKNIKNLILDLRGNGGGSMDIGFELACYLAPQKLAPYSQGRRLVRNVGAQTGLLKYVGTYSNELLEILKTGVPANMYRKFDGQYFEITGRENYPAVEPYPNNFQGRTFIIADASNASATFQFLNYAKENNLGKIVGQTTGGNRQGINGGNYFFLSLPNSRIEIDIPVYFQAPLTAQKDESVVPDIAVNRQTADIGNNFDRETAVIKEIISGGTKGF